MPRAEILAIGDEILIGRTQDTNSHYIAQQLHENGLAIGHMAVIEDDMVAIRQAIHQALDRADILIITGGLGPTKDDRTKQVLAEIFGNGHLVTHEPTLQKIERYYERSGRKMNEYSMRMAMVPDTAEVIENPVGASPALRFDTPDEQAVFALPGVPYEMVHLLDQEVMPYLRAHFVKRHVRSQIFRLVGIPESNLSKLLSDLEEELPPEIRLAYNPGMGLIDLRLYLECELNRQRAFDQRFEASAQQLEELIAEYHYGYKDDTLESVLGQILRERKLTLATAESCTGGALAARLISVSGASDYMRGGVVAYSNTLKMDLLGVQAEGLEFNGAVSERVALQMAEGARKHLGADIGISSTGIAGPEGGTDSKPVGTVWLGIADGQETWARCFHFGRDRQQNIERSVITALHQLWRRLRHQKLEAPA